MDYCQTLTLGRIETHHVCSSEVCPKYLGVVFRQEGQNYMFRSLAQQFFILQVLHYGRLYECPLLHPKTSPVAAVFPKSPRLLRNALALPTWRFPERKATWTAPWTFSNNWVIPVSHQACSVIWNSHLKLKYPINCIHKSCNGHMDYE